MMKKIERVKWMLQGVLVVGLVFSSSVPVSAVTLTTGELNNPIEASGIKLIGSDSNGINLEFVPPGAQELLNWMEQADSEEQVGLEGISLTMEAGAPQLPVYSTLVAIPPDAAYELILQPGEKVYAINSGDLAPAPSPARGTEEGPALARMESLQDDRYYKSTGVYPESEVKISGEAWMRNQRLLKVEFYPLQYSALEGMVFWRPSIRVEIILIYPGARAPHQHWIDQGGLEEDPFNNILDGLVINEKDAQGWLGSPNVSPLINDFPIANGQASLKLVVDHAGIYQVSYEDMEAAGMDLSAIDPLNFHLMNLNQEVAYSFEDNGDNVFGPGDKLLFYGESLPSTRLETLYGSIMTPLIAQCPSLCRIKEVIENYSIENVYWLYVGTTPGMHIGGVVGTPGAAPDSTQFTDTLRAEERLEWWAGHFTNADTWLWNRAKPDNTKPDNGLVFTMPITLGVVAPTSTQAFVRGELLSRINTPHLTRLFLNNTAILTSTWSGLIRYPFQVTVPANLLQSGQNHLRFQVVMIKDSQGNNYPQDIYFDWFEISYGRAYSAVNNRLAIHQEAAGSWKYSVSGLTDNVNAIVWDVTDPLHPIEVTGVDFGTPGQVEFELSNNSSLQLSVTGGGGMESPLSITWYEPPELEPTGGADYIFITHQDLMTATQELANYRSGLGLRTVVVNIDDVYDQFNFGIYHTIAIRNYLEKAMLTWPGLAPRYVLLVGDATFEIRQSENGFNDEINYVPPHLGIMDPWQGEIDGTGLLAAVVGNDILPDLAIGRIPAKTAAEVYAVINKTIAYEQAPSADWQRRMIYLADNKDYAGDFLKSSNALANTYTASGFSSRKFYYCPDPAVHPDCSPANPTNLRLQFISELNVNGALFVNYAGHGAVPSWAGERLFHRDDITTLNNGGMLPIVLSWTCLDGFFYHPYSPILGAGQRTPSLVEALLMTPEKGAVATFSPTGLGVGTGHDLLAQGFYNTIYVNGIWDLGAASLGAKAKLYGAGAYDDLMKTYLIFGDPALQIPLTSWTYLPHISR